jgi:hypothetical protein
LEDEIMPTSQDPREAVALFKSAAALQEAIDDLLSSGFDRAELSLLATEEALRRKFGDRFKNSAELEDAEDVPRCCYVSPESLGDAEGSIIGGLVYIRAVAATGLVILSGGALAAAIAAAVVSGGAAGAVGSFLAERIEQIHARHTAEHLEQGGLLLWVRTWNQEDEDRATAILKKHSGVDVHLHGLRASA